MNRIEQMKIAVEESIEMAENAVSKLSAEIVDMEGMSGCKNRRFLNNLIGKLNPRYLEIGCWKGSTHISALYNNSTKYSIAIDNFSQFNGPREEFHNNCKKFLGNPINFIDADCFSIDPIKSNITDIDVYFYDGEHSVDSQRKAITHYYDSLSDTFLLMVDDWNWSNTRTGTLEGINSKNIKIIHQWEKMTEIVGDKTSWWNGFFIAICKK